MSIFSGNVSGAFFVWLLFSLVQGFSHTAVKQSNMCPPQKKKKNKKNPKFPN